MIDPASIRVKAERLYGPCLDAWLADDESFFPRVLRVDLRPNSSDIAAAAAAVQSLRAASKETMGFGFTVEWQEINSRKLGRNQFPKRVVFPTRDDLLRYLGKGREFSILSSAVGRLRSVFPDLESWIRSNPRILLDVATDLEGLIEVVTYLREHPRPQCFARELPLSVDTKFIERRQSVLRAWLDRLLPPTAIAADEEYFERRFGLRYAEPHVLVRLLDSNLRAECGFPCDEFSIPIRELRKFPLRGVRVLIVENKVPQLTVPLLLRTVALGGLGKAVTLFRDVPMLADAEIVYWGDVDPPGFEILSSLRAIYPQVQSLLMDGDSLEMWRDCQGAWNGVSGPTPLYLTVDEQAAFTTCSTLGLRIEQERLPLRAFTSAIQRWINE